MRRSSSEKVELWRERFTRSVSRSETIASFCESEGVSVASYYYWQRKLGSKSGRRAGRSRRFGEPDSETALSTTGVFRPVEIRPDFNIGLVTTSKVLLGDDVEIQLGSDLATVATIIGELFKQTVASAPDSTPRFTEDPTC